jgi:nucleotide-binding universal stress UspA family protein
MPFQIVTKSGREDEEILTFAKQENVDIIVMGTHGRTGVEHVFFGSVAEKVLRHSPFPVFVIPCKKKHEWPIDKFIQQEGSHGKKEGSCN